MQFPQNCCNCAPDPLTCFPIPCCPPPNPPLAINMAPLVNIGNTSLLRPLINPNINVGNFNQPRFHQRSVIIQGPLIGPNCGCF